MLTGSECMTSNFLYALNFMQIFESLHSCNTDKHVYNIILLESASDFLHDRNKTLLIFQ